MANYQLLKADIDAKVYENAYREITGEKLNSVLNAMVTILGAEYQFAGVATTATNPGTPDAKVFYIANGKGTYTNFGSLEVTEDEVVVLYWDTAWHKVATGIASQAKLSELESEFATKQDIIPDLDTIRAGAALGASSLQKEIDPSVPSWAKAATKPSYTPAEIGAASEDSLQSHENDNTRHITAIERTKWNAKQDALTLTVKDNGNIVLANIQGQSKEFMPATPSGDPMHYAYVTAGAEYNDTGEDIVKTTPWADMIDDDYTGEYGKTVVHKAGYWYLNGLGDITNEQMRQIYAISISEQTNIKKYLCAKNIRTNFIMIDEDEDVISNIISFSDVIVRRTPIEVLRVPTNRYEYANSYGFSIGNIAFTEQLKVIYGLLNCASLLPFFNGYSSNIVAMKLFNVAKDYNINLLNQLSVKSVLYMINNEAATSPITITLHNTVYNRCMANADILAALEAHTNVSLASA